MSAIIKLFEAKSLLEQFFDEDIKNLDLNQDRRQLHIVLNDGVEIYVIYNNHDEYGYSVIFSKLDLDRVRFDNYDKIWDTSSNPHHCHPRYKKEAISSNMKGDPKTDIPLLHKMIKSGILF